MDLLVTPSGAVTAHPGGAPFNVARTIARLGGRCQFLGRLGDDAFGRHLRAALEEDGVQIAVPAATTAPTTLAVAELDDAGVADYRFYLEGTAAGQLAARDVPPGLLDHTPGDRARGPRSVDRADGLDTAGPAQGNTGYDDGAPGSKLPAPGHPRPDQLSRSVDAFLRRSDLVKVSVDDLEVLDPGADQRGAAHRLLAQHPAAVLVTDGPRPVTVYTAAGAALGAGAQR